MTEQLATWLESVGLLFASAESSFQSDRTYLKVISDFKVNIQKETAAANAASIALAARNSSSADRLLTCPMLELLVVGASSSRLGAPLFSVLLLCAAHERRQSRRAFRCGLQAISRAADCPCKCEVNLEQRCRMATDPANDPAFAC